MLSTLFSLVFIYFQTVLESQFFFFVGKTDFKMLSFLEREQRMGGDGGYRMLSTLFSLFFSSFFRLSQNSIFLVLWERLQDFKMFSFLQQGEEDGDRWFLQDAINFFFHLFFIELESHYFFFVRKTGRLQNIFFLGGGSRGWGEMVTTGCYQTPTFCGED